MNLNADLGEGAGADEAILALRRQRERRLRRRMRARYRSRSRPRCAAGSSASRSARIRGTTTARGSAAWRLPLSAAEIEALVAYQVAGLAAVVPIAYVKPHGALYHRCQRDPAAADAVARVAKAHGVGLLGQPDFEILAAAGPRRHSRLPRGLRGPAA